ncbi:MULTISPECIES: xanthine dehydrogenase family protein subunit M [Micrococcaceae]|uniref:FAD binding domain-containing protein n=1 Tax=Micrococcaceae TaxID=1268 RepID=UPI001CFF9325|nr:MULTISPECIES: xanthine dehydrogenase family protein subunit M [Micrococcaceae]MCB5280458.1 Carbon monoxide dehydrogenase medium chain [Arthrobacter sp. ES1]MDJ0351840.1 xanthine dehydrogenase family protein subunit M [Pseudarthrobacter sp. PH31-O2]WGZ81036.1 xanthine dehydrogenase family protein subunit M [Arthrobacter sp. EM1]
MQIPAPFDYVRATSVDNALELLSRHGPESRVIAGGHSLLPMMKLRLSRPEWLIDINDLYELDFVLRDGDTLRIGALTRHSTLLESDEIAALFPIVRDAEAVIADPVVRNRGTIGGSLCQADPAEDLSTVCDVLGAEAVIRGPAGERVLAIADFHRGPYETAVGQDELLCELRFPIRPRAGSAYEKVERRVGDWAVGAAGASVTLAADGTITDAAVGLTALGLDHTVAGATELLRGQQPREELFVAAGRIAAEACDPVADQRGPIDYKRHLADELTRRVLRQACARAAQTQEG